MVEAKNLSNQLLDLLKKCKCKLVSADMLAAFDSRIKKVEGFSQ